MNDFEWNEDKAILNLNKHNISFYEASTVFDDYFGKIIDDKIHSINELRYYLIGFSNNNKLLTVSFTERDNRIRIISARNSTKSERKLYENEN